MVRSHDSVRPGAPMVLLPLLLLLLPGFVHAQTKLTFTPRVSVEETYDDNITRDSKGRNPDWITTVSPGFNVAVDSEHTKLNFDLSGGYSFYLQDSDRDTTVLGSTLSLDQRLSSRFSIQASDTFARTEEPNTEEGEVITDVSRQRRVQYRNTGEAGLSYQFGPENRLTGGYRNRLLESKSDQDEDSLGNEGFLRRVTWFGLRFGIELTGGVNRATFEQVLWLIMCLNIVTRHLDREGGMMFPEPAVDLARAYGSPGHYGRFRSRVRGLPEFGSELPVATLAEEILTEGPGQVRALVTFAGNPALSTPNGRQLDRALASLEFMVSVDPYLNETTRPAHLVLPPTSPLERSHYDVALSGFAVRNFAKYSPALFPAPPGARHDH